MEQTKQTPNEPGQPLKPEEASEVAGGDGCSSVSVGGVGVSTNGTLTDVYDGAVDATSHIIERVVNSF